MKLHYSNSILRHLLFWVIFITYACIIDPIQGSFFVQFIGTILIMFNFSFIYYTEAFFIFPFFHGRRLYLILFLSLTFLITFSISYFTFFYFYRKTSTPTFFSSQPFYAFVVNEMVLFSVTSVVALGTYHNKIGIEKIKLKSEKKKALLLKELGFLKNQFNSHLTLNFLNFCYSNICKSSDETAEPLRIFSKMLAYSLNNKVSEKVKLAAEVEYIEDFIKLQKLLSMDLNVNFTKFGTFDRISIFPRILITPVENAFKHGNIHSIKKPVKIELTSFVEFIIFKVANEKNKHKINEPSGIGNDNLKQQLELLYKDKYTLIIKDESDEYSFELKLHLL